MKKRSTQPAKSALPPTRQMLEGSRALRESVAKPIPPAKLAEFREQIADRDEVRAALDVAGALGCAVSAARAHGIGLPLLQKLVRSTWIGAKRIEAEARRAGKKGGRK